MPPRRNRVDPWGDLQATPERGLFTGNRGCLVDDHEAVVRHHRGSLWIVCLLCFRDQRVPLARPGRWTPLFFLDDAVALAAGHRPCGLCRHADHLAYQRGVTEGLGREQPVSAAELNRRLGGERLDAGRGLVRAHDRKRWTSEAGSLPDGTVIVESDTPRLLLEDRSLAFGFGGWREARPRPRGPVSVLTPPTSVLALAHGFRPTLHPSAESPR